MKKTIHKAVSRGLAEHGWLKSHHSFSFASYYNPERMNFGVLRVLNDDVVAPGMGFGRHPHDNMEIISIPLKGALEHQDNMGTKAVIHANDIQIMSAGTGVQHAEYNHSKTESVNFLQIWIVPKKRNIEPRYDQKTFNPEERKNQFKLVVSPNTNDGSIWINQDAYFSLGSLDAGKELEYRFHKKENGLYVFVLDGELEVAGEVLQKKDALGLELIDKVNFKAIQKTDVLLMEVPMQF